jgi:hypothetical protein
MEAEISLLCSEEQANYIYFISQMNPVHTVSSCFLKMNFNIILQSSTGLPRGLLLRFSHQNVICTSLQCMVCVVLISSSLILLCQQYLSRNTNYRVPNYANFSSLLLLLPLRAKYPSYHPILKHPSLFFPVVWDLYNTIGQTADLFILINAPR